MMEENNKIGAARDLAETLQMNCKPEIIQAEFGSTDGTGIMLIPASMKAESIKPYMDEYLEKPTRRKGTAVLRRAKSFIELVNRFKGDNSVLFAKVKVMDTSIQANINAIFDYHPANGDVTDADNCDHKATYSFPLSKKFEKWLAGNGKGMDQSEFAFMLESRIADIADPGDDDTARIAGLKPNFAEAIGMLELARNLEIYSNETFVQAYKTSSGEKELKFKSENVDADGKPVSVPDFFVINLPLFEGGNPQRILVHLRYRKNGASITWYYELYNVDEMLGEGFESDCQSIQEEVALPLYFGEE